MEYVRNTPTGFELVKKVLDLIFVIPIRPKVTRLPSGSLLVGHEPDLSRSILVNRPDGSVQVMTVTA